MKKIFTAICATLSAVCLFGCTPQEPTTTLPLKGKQYLFYTFGVPVYTAIYAYYDDEAEAAKADETVKDLQKLFAEVEDSLSASIDGSSVCRFNEAEAGATVEIDATAYEVLSIAKEMYALTEGAYNPAVGNSVDLWGFTPRFNEDDYEPTMPYDREYDEETKFVSLPDETYVEAFRTLCDFSKVEAWEDGGKYYMQKPEDSVTLEGVTYTMRLDLGGIGKGYAADRGAELLKERGYTRGYLNVGTSSLALMESASEETDHAWNLGFRHPRGDGNYISMLIKDECVSSSGDYENYYEYDGTRYCHIIDPFTGKPIAEDVVTATVLGLSAAQADAVSTALCVMGTERAIEFINEQLSDKTVVFVRRADEGKFEIVTNAEQYTLIEQSYRVASRVVDGVLEYVE